jgi:hypothetical protein
LFGIPCISYHSAEKERAKEEEEEEEEEEDDEKKGEQYADARALKSSLLF